MWNIEKIFFFLFSHNLFIVHLRKNKKKASAEHWLDKYPRTRTNMHWGHTYFTGTDR